MTLRFVISLLFALLVAIFALQNSMSVTINFLFAEFTISQALVILISAVFGAIFVLFLGTIKQIKSNMKIRTLTKTANMLEEENKILKEQIEQNTENANDTLEENNLDTNKDNEDQH